jgi:DNA-binding transcriptional regulator YiaG
MNANLKTDSKPTVELRVESYAQKRARWERVAAVVITATRRHKRLTQDMVADRLGWSRNMLANLESARRTIAFGDLMLISEALEIEPQALMTRIMQFENPD